MPAQLYILGVFRVDCHIATYPRSTAHPKKSRTSRTHTKKTLAIHFISTPQPSKFAGCQFTESDSWHLQCLHLFAFSQYHPFVPHDLQRYAAVHECKEMQRGLRSLWWKGCRRVVPAFATHNVTMRRHVSLKCVYRYK